jgi:hypothetical protein
MDEANRAYEAALAGEDARTDAMTNRDVARGYEWAETDQEGTTGDIQRLLPLGVESVDPRDFLMAQQGAVERGQAAAPVQGISQGGPPTTAQSQWGNAVGGQNADRLARFQRGLSREWATQRTADQQDSILSDRAIRRLMQARVRADLVQREQIDDMIGKLAWARQQRQLQNRMRQAEGTGAEQMMWGQTLGAAGQTIGAGVDAASESKGSKDAQTKTDPPKV